MLIGFDYYVELESAKHVPVFVKPSKIRGLLCVENGKRTRITFWDGNSYLVEGSITKVAETLFNPQKKNRSRLKSAGDRMARKILFRVVAQNRTRKLEGRVSPPKRV